MSFKYMQFILGSINANYVTNYLTNADYVLKKLEQNYTDTYRKCGNRLNHSSHSDNSWGLPEGQIKTKMVINLIHAYEFTDCYKVL